MVIKLVYLLLKVTHFIQIKSLIRLHFFAAKYANLPYWKPYLAPGHHEFVNGANFASAGSCVLPESDPNTVCININTDSHSFLQTSVQFWFASREFIGLIFSFFGQINLHMQLRYFKNVSSLLKQQLGKTKAKKLLKNAVFLFSSGGNDCWLFEFTEPNATQSQKQEYANLVIGNITEIIKVINIIVSP